MDNVIHQLKYEINKKNTEILQISNQKKIKIIENQQDSIGLQSIVQLLKQIIVKNDFEKKSISKEINELSDYIKKHSQSELYLIQVENSIVKTCENEKYESKNLKDRLLYLKNMVNTIKSDIYNTRKEIQGLKDQIIDYKARKKYLEGKIEQFKNICNTDFIWLSDRNSRRKLLNATVKRNYSLALSNHQQDDLKTDSK